MLALLQLLPASCSMQVVPVLPGATLLCQHQEHWGLPPAPHQGWHSQPFGDGHGRHILRRWPTSGNVKEAPEPGRTGVWAGSVRGVGRASGRLS